VEGDTKIRTDLLGGGKVRIPLPPSTPSKEANGAVLPAQSGLVGWLAHGNGAKSSMYAPGSKAYYNQEDNILLSGASLAS
jgi:hypothetical protein